MKGLIIIVSALIIGLVVGYAIVYMKKEDSKRYFIIAISVSLLIFGVPLLLSNSKKINTLPELSFEKDDGYKNNITDTAIIDYVGSIVVENGDVPIDLSFVNNKKNKCGFVVSMYLADGTKLYESEKINPNTKLVVSKFDTKIKKGIYKDVIVCYDFINNDNNPTGRCEFTIEITSI